MTKNKTTQTQSSVTDFVHSIEDEIKRKDSFELIRIMQKITGFEPKMWGSSIIGFGSYHYKYASGHQGDAPLAAFSPRKAAISVYLYVDSLENKEELFAKLGKHKASKGCLYIKKLADIDLEILEKTISKTIDYLKLLYPSH